ncbi:hypothetical protein ACX8XP_11445 [Calditrichota bacterium LG25]
MQRLRVFILIFMIFSSLKAQNTEASRILEYRSPALWQVFEPDSVDARSILYFNRYAYQVAKYGVLSGIAGASLGAGLIWFNTRNQPTCDLGCAIAYAVATLGGGALGFALGTLYASIKYRNDVGKTIHTKKRNVVFKKTGISLELASPGFYRGLLYRRLNEKKYLPSTISVHYYTQEASYNYESTAAGETGLEMVFMDGRISGVSARLLWVDYRRVAGWLYGFEVGWGSGSLKEYRYNQWKNKSVSGMHVQLCFGSNMNITPVLGVTAFYRYRLYGFVEALQPQGYQSMNDRSSFLLGLVFYLY